MEIEIIKRRRLPDGSLSIARRYIAPAIYFVECADWWVTS